MVWKPYPKQTLPPSLVLLTMFLPFPLLNCGGDETGSLPFSTFFSQERTYSRKITSTGTCDNGTNISGDGTINCAPSVKFKSDGKAEYLLTDIMNGGTQLSAAGGFVFFRYANKYLNKSDKAFFKTADGSQEGWIHLGQDFDLPLRVQRFNDVNGSSPSEYRYFELKKSSTGFYFKSCEGDPVKEHPGFSANELMKFLSH